LVALGQLDGAAEAYQESLAIRRDIGEETTAMAPLAGLAQVALAQRDLAGAQAHAEEILAFVQENERLDGLDTRFQTYWICYQALKANGDPRAADLLALAYRLLQEQSSKAGSPELQRSFLENVAAHREISSEWRRVHNKEVPT
jgi:hypothetical protein